MVGVDDDMRPVGVNPVVDERASGGRGLPPKVMVEVKARVSVGGAHHGVVDVGPLDGEPCCQIRVLSLGNAPVKRLCSWVVALRRIADLSFGELCGKHVIASFAQLVIEDEL